jgi:leucyl aminopeptidase (aminopeptidase T)
MKHYLAIFTGSPASMDAWSSLDPAQREAKEKAGMAAWKAWAEKNQASIVEQGSPLGKTKQVTAKGIADIRNNMAAYTVVQADSQDAAAKLFENHPHFTIFPGDGVEVMECLPMPEGV